MIGIPDTEPLVISEYFGALSPMGADEYDHYLEHGWRHYAGQFCRYNFGDYNGDTLRVIPLRMRLTDFKLRRSQRRILRINQDLDITIGEIALRPAIFDLFERHRERYAFGPPDSIYDHIHRVANIPRPAMQLTALRNGEAVAASFFDCGERSVSSVYTCFDPDLASRSLGILSILKIVEWAREQRKRYYYPGYAYEEKSFYDYKKRLGSLEAYDWRGNWKSYSQNRLA